MLLTIFGCGGLHSLQKFRYEIESVSLRMSQWIVDSKVACLLSKPSRINLLHSVVVSLKNTDLQEIIDDTFFWLRSR